MGGAVRVRQDAMASTQFMLAVRRLVSIGLTVGCLLVLLPAGCGPQLKNPDVLVAPDVPSVWAVVPMTNESGVSQADMLAFSDILVQQIEEVHGLQCLPLNRTISAMQALGLKTVMTNADARLLQQVHQVDGLVVGTVTAWDPYPPIVLGAALQLYLRDAGHQQMNPRDVVMAFRERDETGSNHGGSIIQASGLFDASNHRTLVDLANFARGRHVPDSAFGEDVYLVSMDRYTQFASFRLVRQLLLQQQIALTAQATDD